MSVQSEAVFEILRERARQDAKWGIQTHDFMEWNTILSEEVGELAHEMLGYHFGAQPELSRHPNLRAEAVQVAAVALAIVEAIDSVRILPHRHTVKDGCP